MFPMSPELVDDFDELPLSVSSGSPVGSSTGSFSATIAAEVVELLGRPLRSPSPTLELSSSSSEEEPPELEEEEGLEPLELGLPSPPARPCAM